MAWDGMGWDDPRWDGGGWLLWVIRSLASMRVVVRWGLGGKGGDWGGDRNVYCTAANIPITAWHGPRQAR